jgi:hypothetical protein
MPAEGDVDTSRVAVKTYVPAYQKDEWQSHADRLGMSQSEFVRTMVQAGRRGFLDGPEESGDTEDRDTDDTDETDSTDGDAGGDDLRERVVDALEDDSHHDWEELLEAVTDDIESRLEETLAELQDDNVVRYSGRHGGYTLIEQ